MNDVELLIEAPATPAEGPLWDADRGVLWWVDIMVGQLHAFDPATGTDVAVDLGSPVGTVGLCTGGGLVVALDDRVELLAVPPTTHPNPRGDSFLSGGRPTDPAGWARTVVTTLEADQPRNRANDGKPGPDGALWVGTMAIDATAGRGSLYRVDRDGVHRCLAGLGIPNGLDWPDPADPTTMLWTDSLAGGVDVLTLGSDGTVLQRRRHIAIDRAVGLPDGLTIDADGRIWVAIHGAGIIAVHDADGTRSGTIEVGHPNVTSCAFGGPDLTDLYLTVAAHSDSPGGLHRLRDVGPGRPPLTFQT